MSYFIIFGCSVLLFLLFFRLSFACFISFPVLESSAACVKIFYHHVGNFSSHSSERETKPGQSPVLSQAALPGNIRSCRPESCPLTGSHAASLLHEHLIHLAFIQAQKPELSSQVLFLLKE